MQMEKRAGLGFGLSMLLLVSVLAAVFIRKKKSSVGHHFRMDCVRFSLTVEICWPFDRSCPISIGKQTHDGIKTAGRDAVPEYDGGVPGDVTGRFCGTERRIVVQADWNGLNRDLSA